MLLHFASGERRTAESSFPWVFFFLPLLLTLDTPFLPLFVFIYFLPSNGQPSHRIDMKKIGHVCTTLVAFSCLYWTRATVYIALY